MHLREVQQKDLYDFSRVAGIALWDDEIVKRTAPHKQQHPELYYLYCLHRTKCRWYRGEHLFLAVSDEDDSDWTGQEVILGYCGYSTTVDSHQKPVRGGWLGNVFEQTVLSCWEWYASTFGVKRHSDLAAEAHFRSAIGGEPASPYFESLPEKHKERHGDQHWELELLGTHPNFRRRGVGKMMLQWGFERATEDNVPLILIASIIGEKLYLHAGFKEVSRISTVPVGENTLDQLDMGLSKGRGLTWAVMAWEPEGLGE